MEFGIAGVAAITVIAYTVGLLVKAAGLNCKWIPAICATVGGVLGMVGLRIMPDFPAGDYITACAVGPAVGSPTRSWPAVAPFWISAFTPLTVPGT